MNLLYANKLLWETFCGRDNTLNLGIYSFAIRTTMDSKKYLGISLLLVVVFGVISFLYFNPYDFNHSINRNEDGGSERRIATASKFKRGSIPIIEQLPSPKDLGKHFFHDHKPSHKSAATPTNTASKKPLNCGLSSKRVPDYLVLTNSGGGYTNQILSLMIKANIAEHCGSNIVFGNYTERRGYDGDYKDAIFVEVPLLNVITFDFDTPVLKGRILDVPISSPVPQCGFGERLADLNDIDCHSLPDGAAIHSHFDTFKIPFHRIVSFLTSIRIASKKVLDRCEAAKKAMRPYTCWHPRNEKDWGEAYNFSKVNFVLNNKFIVSGVKKVHWSGKSYFKDDFDMKGLSATEKLQFDFCVCTDADRFVGVLSSTFSYYVWIVRLAQNRLKNRIVSNNGMFWSTTMHELYVTGIAGYFNLFLSDQIVIL